MTYIEFLLYYDPIFGVNTTNKSCWHDFVTGNLLVLPEVEFSKKSEENRIVTEPIKTVPLYF